MNVRFIWMVALVLGLLVAGCGQKSQTESTPSNTSASSTEEETPPVSQKVITDDDYITYVVEYTQLKDKLKQAREENDVEQIRQCQEQMLALDQKYPDAAQYPTSLPPERMDELGKKLEEAMMALENASTN
ncbi:MAG: hypothetical protein D6675_13790 [Gemmatimonadetes bacterium]|nr:MAG: hypothetical protein D6675_13790 [Gemmatimonadota bacterium]